MYCIHNENLIITVVSHHSQASPAIVFPFYIFSVGLERTLVCYCVAYDVVCIVLHFNFNLNFYFIYLTLDNTFFFVKFYKKKFYCLLHDSIHLRDVFWFLNKNLLYTGLKFNTEKLKIKESLAVMVYKYFTFTKLIYKVGIRLWYIFPTLHCQILM